MKSRCTNQSGLKQIDLCPPIHLALDQLEFCDLSFCLAVGPLFGDGGTDGGFVTGDSCRE